MSSLVAVLAVRGNISSGGGGGSKSRVALLVVGLFFILIGGVQAANPRLLWRMNKWQYKNPEANEPSDKGYTFQRVLGAIFVVVGVALVIVAITKL